ncbi:MAG: hypothetical protein WCJ95_15245, partial [Mariniphaga sp.]
KFSTDCKTCHTTTAWAPSSFNHNTATTFPLANSHIGVSCISCHAAGYAGIPTTCVSCHLDKYNATTTPSHTLAKYPTDCSICHTVTVWTTSTFDHNTTGFPLTGTHTTVLCATCHTNGFTGGTPTTCSSCHLTNFNASTNPNHTLAKFSTDCKTCHTTTAWAPSSFNHNTATTFPLANSHIGVSCISCHAAGYAGIPTTCVSCHLDKYNATTTPSHTLAKYPTDCSICHTVTVWTTSTFDHNTTAFPLTGTHTTVLCATCHTNGFSGGTPTTCSSCHLTNFNASTNPNHTLAKFSTDCKTCHTTTAWAPSSFNHNTATTFSLTGSHIGLTCISCHTAGYAGISTDCVSCHLSDFNSTNNPGHVAAKFPTDCTLCHSTTSWTTSTFNHNTTTSFPLTGAHIGVDCASCHTAGYVGISIECTSCHLANYNATTIPNHTSAQFSTDCKTCHTTLAWVPSTYNHNVATTFPLTGAHIGVSCVSCHSKGYAGISTDCVSCHLTNFNATTTPAHATAKYPTDCTLCHTTSAWVPSSFNHNTTTVFPLTGAHTTVDCVICHTNGFTGGTPTDCASCHIASYNASVNPNHIAAKFPTDCKICHSTTAWIPNSFNHNTATTFPLTGSHIGVACINCHSTGYIGISTACVSCHQNDYNATTSPAHLVAKFPTDCKICHTTTLWVPSTFNHTTGTTFPLTGSHIGVSCISCHTAGYAGISTLCVSCHLNEFNTTNNPAHAVAKFPTNCEFCHTVTVWTTTTYNHDAQYFPIYSGNHQGAWTLCTQCHTTATNFGIFNCLVCHPQTTMASAHKALKTYLYNSTNCYACHPKGTS